MDKEQWAAKDNLKNTFLDCFIKDKLNCYVKPKRTDNKGGMPAGFSKIKYFTALIMLKDLKQIDIANRLNVSHAVIRTWRTQKPFKELVKNFCIEFSDLLIDTIRAGEDLSCIMSNEIYSMDVTIRLWKFIFNVIKNRDISNIRVCTILLNILLLTTPENTFKGSNIQTINIFCKAHMQKILSQSILSETDRKVISEYLSVLYNPANMHF